MDHAKNCISRHKKTPTVLPPNSTQRRCAHGLRAALDVRCTRRAALCGLDIFANRAPACLTVLCRTYLPRAENTSITAWEPHAPASRATGEGLAARQAEVVSAAVLRSASGQAKRASTAGESAAARRSVRRKRRRAALRLARGSRGLASPPTPRVAMPPHLPAGRVHPQPAWMRASTQAGRQPWPARMRRPAVSLRSVAHAADAWPARRPPWPLPPGAPPHPLRRPACRHSRHRILRRSLERTRALRARERPRSS